MVTVSRAVVVGTTCLVRAYRFASSVVTPRGYKAGDHPCAHLSSLAQTPVASSPPLLHLKREGDREREIETGEICGAQRALLLLPSQTMAEQGWTPSEVAQVHL
jgi:hypothetical protein